VTHAFLAPLRAAKGRIVNIGSHPVVHASAHAEFARPTRLQARVLGFTRALAAELGKGRRARHAIGPGFIENAAEREGARQQSELAKVFIRSHATRARRQARGHRGAAIFLGRTCRPISRIDRGWRMAGTGRCECAAGRSYRHASWDRWIRHRPAWMKV